MYGASDYQAVPGDIPMNHLLAAAQQGDRSAQYAIVRRFENLILKLLKAEQDPLNQEDLRQDLNVGILEVIRRFSGAPDRFPGYVKQTLISIRARYIRRQAQQRQLLERLASRALPLIYYPVYPRLEADSIRERNQQLWNAFCQLSPEEREIISYRLKPFPLSWRSIGKQMGQNHNQIYRKYQQILRKMRTSCRTC